MNPYAHFVKGPDVIGQVESGPAKFKAAVDRWRAGKGLGASYAPGKWTIHQVMTHLADCEIAFAFRLRQAAAEADHTIQPFDQDHWMAVSPGATADEALALYSALREWNVKFLRGLKPGMFEKTVTHPERGAMQFQTIVETIAGHDGNHLAQLS